MQDLIKRHFWVLGALVVMTCAVFAAKATNHVVEAKLLGEADHAAAVVAVAPQPTAPIKPTRSKDGAQLAARDLFCSDCTPAVAAANVSNDPSQIPTTTLPIVLLATNVSANDAQSFGTILNTENQRQGAYGVGDKVLGGGPIKAVHYKYVDFDNNGHTERVILLGATVPVTAPPPVVAEATPEGDKDEMQAAIDNGIKRIDDNNYEIDKALVEKVLLNPMAVAKGARVVPAVKNGKPDGFKLYAIRPSSVFAKLGLTNGDTLQAINGFELTSADKALEVYTKLREATSLEVEVTRRGKSTTLKYQIR